MTNRAIKYRLCPTKEQAILFDRTFGCCRKVYNLMLADKIESYSKTKKFGKQTPAMYKSSYPFLKEVDSLALANVQLHLEQAIRNHFNPNGHFNFPKFKSKKHTRRSFTTNNQKGTIAIINSSIRLPKTGFVKAYIHRMPEADWKLKSATIFQESDGTYYASVLFEYEEKVEMVSKSTDRVLGLDYKSDGLYMDSNGNIGTNHKYYQESHEKLARAQRKLSKKQKDSRNYFKQKKKVGKIHKHIKNQRTDNLQKKSTEIANLYDVVCVETLNMKKMSSKSFGNGKATMDNGYGKFLNLLEYKLEERGKYFVKVDKWYSSSQICSKCGNRKKIPLSKRTYECECGNTMDRDYNAAINIKNEGLRILKEN